MSTNHNRIKIADLEKNQPNKILTTNENGELEFGNIDAIKVDSYNALDYNQEGKALDARQGKVLKDLIDNLKDTLKIYFDTLYLGISNDQSISGSKTFLAGKLGLRNVANTFTSFFSNTNTASRTYTLQNRNGTLLDNTDLSSINSSLATKQSVFIGISNYITKSLNTTTLSSSRLFDNGVFFGIGTSKVPIKDITLGNQSNREIGIEESSNTIQGRDLIVAAGRTINYVENTNFNDLSQISRIWMGMTWHTNGNVYAGVQGGDIFVRINGIGDFISLGQSLGNSIRSMGRDEQGNIYASGSLGIFKQTNGIGNFLPIPSPSGLVQGVSGHINGNVYACVGGESSIGDIYIQNGGIGNFIPIGGTPRAWAGICCHPNGNVYASAYNSDIYMQTNGTGPFIALGLGAKGWHQISCHQNGNVYVVLYTGDIYQQINGMGPFIALEQGSADRRGITTSSNENVYASVVNKSIFMQQNNVLGKPNLQGGTIKLKAGTGKGTGQSRIEFITGQKTISGTEMQIETARAYIDENGYMVWNSMPTFANNFDAIAGGLPIGCEYKTATGDRKIVY